MSEGVNCAACHQRRGGILTATSPDAAPEVFEGSPHPLVYAPELAESTFCGGCHEFKAPSIDGRMQAGGALQSTWSEWASTGSSRTCQSCHLEGHAFQGRELMAEALEIEVEGRRLRVRLRPDAVAHAVPTGDPFRHLRLLACADDRCAPPLASWGVGRLHTFDGETWWPGLDRRLGPAGTGLADALEVQLPEGAQSWQLRYRLASPSDLHALPPDEGELLLASGPLAPEGEP